MDALISYSLPSAISNSDISSSNTMLNNTSSASPISQLIQNPMYYHSQMPGGATAAYNHLFLNQYNTMQQQQQQQHHQQHQQNQQQKADFLKLFAGSSNSGGSSIPSSASSVCSSSSTHSMPNVFLPNSQQGLLNSARFGPNQLGGMMSGSAANPNSCFLTADDSGFYNSGFNSSLVGQLASKVLKHGLSNF